MKEDISVTNKTAINNNEFLNKVIYAVCIEGDCYNKYKQDIIRCLGDETNEKIIQLLNELDVVPKVDGASKRIFQSYRLTINYLGADIGIESSTIDKIIGWQQKRLSHADCGIMLLFVVATNFSMRGLTSHRISKAEFGWDRNK